MVRPKKNRIVAFKPDVSYFKPRGIPMIDLTEVNLTVDERESIRLADLIGMSHEEAGKRMGVSRATFGRIVQRARKIVADSLINGKAIKIEGGNYSLISEKEYLYVVIVTTNGKNPLAQEDLRIVLPVVMKIFTELEINNRNLFIGR